MIRVFLLVVMIAAAGFVATPQVLAYPGDSEEEEYPR